MPKHAFPPFPDLVGVAEALWAGHWALDGDEIPSGRLVNGWSYGMPLRLCRVVRVNPQQVRAATGLGQDSVLRVAVAWSAQAAINLGERGPAIDVSLSGESPADHQVEVDVPSKMLAEQLNLTTAVVLLKRGQQGVLATAAKEPGSVLWRESAVFLLEGRQARMPIIARDFVNHPSREINAAWYVWTGPDWLNRHPSVGIVVNVNSARTGLLASLTTRSSGPVESTVRSAFFHDVGRALALRALDEEETFDDDSEFTSGTSGDSLRRTLKTLFSHQTLAQIRALRMNDPAAFERILQSWHNFLGNLR